MQGPFPWLLFVFLANAAAIGGAWVSLVPDGPGRDAFGALALVALAGGAAVFVMSWKIVDYQITRRIRRLAAEVRAIAFGSRKNGIDQARYALIAPLPEAINHLCGRLTEARRQLTEGLEGATRQAEENARRLATIVNDLHESVLVCNLRHQIVLFNPMAVDMLAAAGPVGLGRSLFETLARAQVLHAFSQLANRPEASRGMPFLAGSLDGKGLFQGRMSLLRDETGGATGYVVTLVDAARTRRHADVSSAELFSIVGQRLGEGKATATGLPVWLHGDPHALVPHLAGLIEATGTNVDLAAEIDDDITAWIEILWSGPPLDSDTLLRFGVAGAVQEHRDGETRLRIRVKRGTEVLPEAVLPARPDFYDMTLLAKALDTGEYGARPLSSLTFVVFDTETTGLAPSAGDKIVQIGAVRIVNGRILSGDSFERVVDPGRPIPPESTRFHGLTDDMVKGKPPIQVALRQFKAFAAGDVLVAHNAAFDLKFLKMSEKSAGVTFDNPVLDTMMLSDYLDGPDAGHSLDAVCERHGIENTGRHTALGDAMVTAAVLLHQIDALAARGITTLDQAVKALDLTLALHQRQQAL